MPDPPWVRRALRLVCWLFGHKWDVGQLCSGAAEVEFCGRCGTLRVLLREMDKEEG